MFIWRGKGADGPYRRLALLDLQLPGMFAVTCAAT